VGLRAGLDGCGKSRPHQDPISGPSIPQRDKSYGKTKFNPYFKLRT